MPEVTLPQQVDEKFGWVVLCGEYRLI